MATIDFKTAYLVLERALAEAKPLDDKIAQTINIVLTGTTRHIAISW